ncbi:MAG TPA: hypothetical protein PKA55_18010 [Rhodoblastus sp.]|nr:hypothetical protein [Rhodoblastus sp.]
MSLIAFEPRLPDLGAARERALTVFFTLAFRALRFARRRRLEMALVGGLAIVLLVASILSALEEAPAPEPVKPAPVGYWMDVSKPLAMFAFDSQEFAPAPAVYAMRRHTTGGGREDILTFGDFAGDAPWLRLTIHQIGEEGAADQSLFVETARHAGEGGLALENLSNAAALPTRFGVAEWADARLSAPADGAKRENCATFRFAETKPALRVSGLACGPGGQSYNRAQLSCLVGRLDLAAAGGDDELQKFFARPELARDAACPPRARHPGQASPAEAKPAPRRAARR